MDKLAQKILFKTYWQSTGWTDRNFRSTPLVDFEYAKSKSVMFDPITLSWRDLRDACRTLIAEIPLQKITDAFLSSLSTKRADLRSGIASYANITRLLALSEHEQQKHFFNVSLDDDLSVLNFERIKWGGIRHSKPLYNFIDLTILKTETVTTPTQQDIATFNSILNTIRQAAPTDTAAKLRDHLKAVWPVSKGERDIMLEILGCCDILETLNFDRAVHGQSDFVFVVSWRGEDRYNQQKLDHYFAPYGVR